MMARNQPHGNYNASELRSRGWTNQLMRELLPKPGYQVILGNRVRFWPKATVLQAERDPRFAAAKIQKANESASVPRDYSAEIQASLDAAMSAEDASPETVRQIAMHYHRGIQYLISVPNPGHLKRQNQVFSQLSEFLALEHHCKMAALSGVLHNFARVAPWMAENPSSPITHQVFSSYSAVLRHIAQSAYSAFRSAQPEADVRQMLARDDFPSLLMLNQGLPGVWSVWYVPQAIQTSLQLLMALNPKDEYSKARALHRRFILHLGGTNTGKTYAGFQRLIAAKSGVYLAPLRLLALEAQETLLDAGVACSLATGEEEDYQEGDTHVAATAEKLDLAKTYQVAVIDECQMIQDAQRGYAWTRAILGVLAEEVHLCAAPEAKQILIRLIESCGDSYEIEVHERKTPLLMMRHTVDYERIQPGDALITFSKISVLSVAEDLRQAGKEPAIIYGALPYSTRRKQMESFLAGDTQYVVSTDAIGMGLNLPIRRILFMETQKYDGTERRDLKPEEIQQIAGRAGRFGMYDRGYVGATENLGAIRAGMEAVIPPIQHAVLGFSDLVLQADFDLLEVLTEWNRMPTIEPYRKLDITRYITLISKMRERGFLLSKELELRAANIPFDETEEELEELFFYVLRRWSQGEPVEQPGLAEEAYPTLPKLELYYRKLDLYFSFCKAFDCPVDLDLLYERREQVADEINEILLHRLRSNIRFCEQCKRPLPPHHRGKLCDTCFRRQFSGGSQQPWHARRKR